MESTQSHEPLTPKQLVRVFIEGVRIQFAGQNPDQIIKQLLQKPFGDSARKFGADKPKQLRVLFGEALNEIEEENKMDAKVYTGVFPEQKREEEQRITEIKRDYAKFQELVKDKELLSEEDAISFSGLKAIGRSYIIDEDSAGDFFITAEGDLVAANVSPGERENYEMLPYVPLENLDYMHAEDYIEIKDFSKLDDLIKSGKLLPLKKAIKLGETKRIVAIGRFKSKDWKGRPIDCVIDYFGDRSILHDFNRSKAQGLPEISEEELPKWELTKVEIDDWKTVGNELRFKTDRTDYEERQATVSLDGKDQFKRIFLYKLNQDAWKESGFIIVKHAHLHNAYKFNYSVSRFTGNEDEMRDENPTLVIEDSDKRSISFLFDWEECSGEAKDMLEAVYGAQVLQGRFIFKTHDGEQHEIVVPW